MNEHKDNSIGITTAPPPALAPKEPHRYAVICADLATENHRKGVFSCWAVHYALARGEEDAKQIVAARVSEDGYFPVIALDEADFLWLSRDMNAVPLSPTQPFADGHDPE